MKENNCSNGSSGSKRGKGCLEFFRCFLLLRLLLLLVSATCLVWPSFGAETLPYGELFTDGPSNKPWVALTFDDGPGSDTPKFLEMLRRYDAKATFFMMGSQVKQHPDVAREVQKEGHLIGNHTFSHPNFYFYKKEDKREKLKSEIESGREAILGATGSDPVFLRMPNGYVRDWVKEVAQEEKVILVNWTYGSDWTKIDTAQMLKGYLSHLHSGAVLLFHDGGKDRSRTLSILEKVLKEMEKKNLKAVRVDEILGLSE
ncbi:MAG: polysaccharide deacetylase family protein [Elusimicrobia bacterium]|nr:polysaccharide deacetylase family protein [Elusimicrobiota bacterium]